MSEHAEIIRDLSSFTTTEPLGQALDGTLRQAQGGHDRRTAVRHTREGRLTIFQIVAGRVGQATQVGFHDLSANGIGIFHPTPLKNGERFLLGLVQPDDKMTLASYRAVRCDAGRSDGFRVGAELVSVLRANDLARDKGIPGVNAARMGQHLLARLNDKATPPAMPASWFGAGLPRAGT